MMSYWVQARDRIFVKGNGFLSFAKNMDKNIGRNISKILSGKYSQKKSIQTTVEATGHLIGNKIADMVASLTTVKLQKFQKIDSKIFQKQSQMIMIKKYLKKELHLQKMIWDFWWYEINIIKSQWYIKK